MRRWLRKSPLRLPPSARNAGTIVVIGDVMLDIIATPRRPIEFATDTPAHITMLPGGSGANQAAWLGHFGNSVRFIGRVGEAEHDEHAAALAAHGVEPRLGRDIRTRTGTLVTLIDRDGERSFLTDRGANANLDRVDLPDGALNGAALVHVSGYALLGPGPRAAVRDFLALAQLRRIPISVDCGSISFLRAIGPVNFLDWTHGATLCFANSAEAALVTQTADPAAQLAILGACYDLAIITRGPNGAQCTTAAGMQWSLDAPRATARDSSGAGDAFVGGFLTGFLQGEAPPDCLWRGVVAGTSAITVSGGRPVVLDVTPTVDPVVP